MWQIVEYSTKHGNNEVKMNWPERKNIRLRGYSYSSAGTFFITIHVHDAVLSEIVDRGDECPEVRIPTQPRTGRRGDAPYGKP